MVDLAAQAEPPDLTVTGLPRLRMRMAAHQVQEFQELANVDKWTDFRVVYKGWRVTVNLIFDVERARCPKPAQW